MKALLMAMVMAAISINAQAGAYRCQIDGRTVYQGTPCPGGRTVSTLGGQQGSAAEIERLKAQLRAEQEMRRADNLSHDRRLQIEQELAASTALRNAEAERLNTIGRECHEADIEIRRIEDTAKAYPKDAWYKNYAIAERKRFNEKCR